MQPYDLTALAKEISRITTYRSEKAWVETMDYIYDLTSKYPLIQKIKAEDITRCQREVHRYTAFKNETNIYKKMCYADWAFYKTLTSEDKKNALFFKKCFNTRQADIKKKHCLELYFM